MWHTKGGIVISIVNSVDKVSVTGSENFIYTVQVAFSDLFDPASEWTVQIFMPSAVDYLLPATGAMMYDIEEVAAEGGTNLVFKFSDVSDGTSYAFDIGASFGAGRRDGDSFSCNAMLYAGETLMAFDVATPVILTLSENFTVSKSCLSGGKPSPGDVLTYEISLVNNGDLGATIEQVVLTDILPEGLSSLSGTVTGFDASSSGYEDTSQDGATGQWVDGVLTFLLDSYSGERYNIQYSVSVGDVVGGTVLLNTATLEVDGVDRVNSSVAVTTYVDTATAYLTLSGQAYANVGGVMQYYCTHRSASTVELQDYSITIDVPEDMNVEELRCFSHLLSIGCYQVYVKTESHPDVETLVIENASEYSATIHVSDYLDEGDRITSVIFRSDSVSTYSYANWIWLYGRVSDSCELGTILRGDASLNATSALGELEVVSTSSTEISHTSRLAINAEIQDKKDAYYPTDRCTVAMTLPESYNPTIDPVFACYLPAGLSFVEESAYYQWSKGFSALSYDSRNGDFPCLPTVEVLADYQGLGRTLVRFDFSGATVEMFDSLSVYFDGMVLLDAGSEVQFQCYLGNLGSDAVVSGLTYVDVLDLDGDDIVDECIAVSETLSAVILYTSEYTIEKLVKGDLDGSYSTSGFTTAGGDIKYQLIVTNNQTDMLTNIEMIDIFPYVGDVGVVLVDQARGSEFNVFPTGDISAEIINILTGEVIGNPSVFIEYSTSHDPVRFDESGDGTIGSGAWTSEPPSNIATLASIRLTTDEGTVLAPYEQLVVNVVAIAPIGAPVGEIAYNSFAVKANRVTDDGVASMLPVEPNRVGVTIAESVEGVIGQFVWIDSNGDGLYDADEVGLNGVTVELYDSNGAWLNAVVTSDNLLGEPGFYYFTGLPSGSYFVKFLSPTGYELTQQNLESSLGSRPNSETGLTPLISLAEGEYQLLENAGFVSTSSESDLTQAVTDVIESIALEQTALSHILNAEGEKIQRIVVLTSTTEEMVAVNTSVESMVRSIVALEEVLKDKLGTVLGETD